MQCCKCPGHRIGSLSYRTRRNILHSQTDLLDAFLINDNGLILPECYVDILSVENLEMELTGDILRKTKYTDDELTGTVENFCRQFFRKPSAGLLCIEDRYRLARMLYKRYGLSRKQLSRLTMTDPTLLKTML